MTMQRIFENVNEGAIFNRMMADYQARQPAWMPSESDPFTQLLNGQAAREGLVRRLFSELALGLFRQSSTGSDLRALAAFWGLTPGPNETDDELAIRLDAHIDVQGYAGTPEAYRGHALTASTDVADAIALEDAAPHAGRVNVHIIAKESASVAQANNLLGVPSAALLTAVRAYLRDGRRRAVTDRNLETTAASPTEYRIGMDISPGTAQAVQAARTATYAYIDSHRRFGAVLNPSNLTTAIENAINGVLVGGGAVANIETFNISPFNGTATLTATDEAYYDCAKNATGVDIQTT